MESSYTIDLTPACCCGCCCEVDCPTSGTLCLPTGLTFTYGEGTDCFAALDGMTASVGYYDGAGPPWKYNIFGTFGDYVINLSAEWSCLGGCLGLDGAIEVQGPDDCCYGCRPPDGGGHTWIGPLSIYNTGRGGGIPTNNQTCEVVSCSPLNIRVALGPLARLPLARLDRRDHHRQQRRHVPVTPGRSDGHDRRPRPRPRLAPRTQVTHVY